MSANTTNNGPTGHNISVHSVLPRDLLEVKFCSMQLQILQALRLDSKEKQITYYAEIWEDAIVSSQPKQKN